MSSPSNGYSIQSHRPRSANLPRSLFSGYTAQNVLDDGLSSQSQEDDFLNAGISGIGPHDSRLIDSDDSGDDPTYLPNRTKDRGLPEQNDVLNYESPDKEKHVLDTAASERPPPGDMGKSHLTSSQSPPKYRPNRFYGPRDAWLALTREDRQIAEGLEQTSARDLAAHIYNAHFMQLDQIDTVESKTESEPNVEQEHERERDETESLDSLEAWTAWPMPSDEVPRANEHMRRMKHDRFTYRRRSDPWASTELEDVIVAFMLRTAKERFQRSHDISSSSCSVSNDDENHDDDDDESSSVKEESESEDKKPEVRKEELKLEEKTPKVEVNEEGLEDKKELKEEKKEPIDAEEQKMGMSLKLDIKEEDRTSTRCAAQISTEDKASNTKQDSAKVEKSIGKSGLPGIEKTKNNKSFPRTPKSDTEDETSSIEVRCESDWEYVRGPLNPVIQIDDEKSRQKLRPLARDIIARFDQFLMKLHYIHEDSDTLDGTESASETETDNRISVLASLQEGRMSGQSGNSKQRGRKSLRNSSQKSRVRTGHPRGSSTKDERSESKKPASTSSKKRKVIRDRDRSHSRGRKHARKLSKKARSKSIRSNNSSQKGSPSRPSSVYTESDCISEDSTSHSLSTGSGSHRGIMDWRELSGVASMTGWPPSVVMRAVQRCYALFGEEKGLNHAPRTPNECLDLDVKARKHKISVISE